MSKEIQLKNSNWRVILWSILDSGNNVPFIFLMYYFLVYNEQSFGIGGVIVGGIMLLSRMFDAFTDPIIGLFIDKLNTKWGKLRPSLVVGAVFLNISLVAMFWGFEFSSLVARVVFMGLVYAFYIIGYTFLTATWKTGNTVITRDSKQRSMQGLYMSVATMVVVTVMLATVPLYFGGDYSNALAWRQVGIVVALVNVVFVILAIFAISNRDNTNYYVTSETQPSLREFLPILKENKPLSMLIVAASTNKLASTAMSAVTTYWYVGVMQDATGSLQSRMSLIGMPAGIVGIILSTVIAVKWSRRNSMLWGSWMAIASMIAMILIRPFGPDQIGLYMILFAVVNTINFIPNGQINVMIADAADYELWKTGKAIPGMISTTFSFLDKLVSSLSGLVVGSVVGIFNYKTGQPVSTGFYWALIFIMFGIPLLGHIASVWAMKRYEITSELSTQIAHDLKNRKLEEKELVRA